MKAIRTSEDFCNNYSEISELCHTTSKPVYITRDGNVDLVAISIDVYQRLSGRVVAVDEPCTDIDCIQH
ncbi:type II toxin-antitoxin system Phd/YefM family antitoxin [Ruminococcaceae bacterium OttesenSCG-928-L11]|nr:type II toxin-antitoxin system Phd/YefM family antitoxin [Ruminococcaceae bacterium OttesenSCG-928-L11]